MATYKGVVQTAIDAGGLSNQQAAGLINGRVKVFHDYRVLLGTEASGSILEFCGDLPAGAKILQVQISVSVAQATLTAALGTSYNNDEFAVAGNTTLQAALTAWTENGRGYVVGTAALDSQIIVTTGGATTTAGTMYCTVLCAVD